MADDATASAESGTAESTTLSGGRTASEIRDIADRLRNRVDLFGKTLAAVATLGTTAVGLNKIGDLFPTEGEWDWVWAALACLALAVAALAAIKVAVRLMMVAKPVFVSVDPDADGDLDADERDEVRQVGTAAAQRFGYSSLAGLQERERSLRSAALQTNDETERARRLALADDVKTEIEQALARSQVVVVRRRAAQAVSGKAWWLYLAVIAGLIIFAVGTDKVSSSRIDPVAEAKACGDARKAGATASELEDTEVCEGQAEQTDATPEPPSAAEARAQIVEQLAATLRACTALIRKQAADKNRPLEKGACKPVSAAAAGMAP